MLWSSGENFSNFQKKIEGCDYNYTVVKDFSGECVSKLPLLASE